MVLPIVTLPLEVVTTFQNGYKVGYRNRLRRRQKLPIDRPLEYNARYGKFVVTPNSGSTLGSPYDDAETICNLKFYDATIKADLWAKSYEAVKGRIYSQAALGVDFAESRQSLGMITKSLGTLVKFTRDVRSLRFGAAAATLRMKFQPKGVSARRSWSSNWLEYHFGWEPLIKDIHESIEVLNNPLKTFTTAKGRASDYRQVRVESKSPSSAVWSEAVYDTYYLVQQGATVVALTDRGAHTLDQFGLINPAVIAWELIPFSFVVDWFAHVGDVLASFSDFAGMTLKNTYISRKYIVSTHGFNYYRPGYTGDRSPKPIVWDAFGVWTDRSLGLAAPDFGVKKLRLPSSVRAVTAVALLNQLFK